MRDFNAVLIAFLASAVFAAGSVLYLAFAFWVTKHLFGLGAILAIGWLALTPLFFTIHDWLNRVIRRLP